MIFNDNSKYCLFLCKISILLKTAKIIRHRHKWVHTLNDDLKGVEEAIYFKIVFSNPQDFDNFCQWVKDNEGEYNFDKDTNTSNGALPTIKEFGDKKNCWCDIMTWYLLEIEKYTFHSVLSPYKGEIYIKN